MPDQPGAGPGLEFVEVEDDAAVEVVEIRRPGAGRVLLFEQPDPLAGAHVVSVSGAPAPPGGAAARFTHLQQVPQAVWTFTHGRGQPPVAWVLRDLDGRECEGYEVQPLDADRVRVSMEDPTAGTIVMIF